MWREDSSPSERDVNLFRLVARLAKPTFATTFSSFLCIQTCPSGPSERSLVNRDGVFWRIPQQPSSFNFLRGLFLTWRGLQFAGSYCTATLYWPTWVMCGNDAQFMYNLSVVFWTLACVVPLFYNYISLVRGAMYGFTLFAWLFWYSTGLPPRCFII